MASGMGSAVESTWESRELPILRALVGLFDSIEMVDGSLAAVVTATGLPDDDVKRGLKALMTASPPYIEARATSQTSYPMRVLGVTERARREIGQWPTPEALTERLIAALEAAAAREPDREKAGRLRALKSFVREAGRDIVTGAVAGAIGNAL